MSSFADLPIKQWLLAQCTTLGFKRPTPVQSACIPPIRAGRDCLASAKTGSGKTAAFALPIIDALSDDPYGIFALILTPTRELAQQIGEQFRAFGRPIGLRDCLVIGGQSMTDQASLLSDKPHIVVATPGRLADHMRSGTTSGANWRRLRFLVLDEADRLLVKSFNEDLGVILRAIEPTTTSNLEASRRQTLLFSATLSETTKDLERLLPAGVRKPFVWRAESR